MKCLENLARISYPQNLVMNLTKLYRFKGKDFYYEDVLKNYMTGIIRHTIEKDTTYAARLLNLEVSENRMRLLIKKNSQAKTNDEKVVQNLKMIFQLIQEKGEEIELTSNEFLQMATIIFKGACKIDFVQEKKQKKVNLLTETYEYSKRESFDQMMKLYKKNINDGNIEPTQVITNLYVDLLNLKVFSQYNDFISLMIMYALLVRERFNVFKYVSFFECYYKDKESFEMATVQASYDWEKGFSQTAQLNDKTIKLMLDGYEVVEKLINDYHIDKKLKKIDNVETSILKLGTTFTKDQIKNLHPELSESTINRALQRLKEEEKIRPMGTGRSASWMRIVPEEMFSNKNKQLSLFDFTKGLFNDDDEDDI